MNYCIIGLNCSHKSSLAYIKELKIAIQEGCVLSLLRDTNLSPKAVELSKEKPSCATYRRANFFKKCKKHKVHNNIN